MTGETFLARVKALRHLDGRLFWRDGWPFLLFEGLPLIASPIRTLDEELGDDDAAYLCSYVGAMPSELGFPPELDEL